MHLDPGPITVYKPDRAKSSPIYVLEGAPPADLLDDLLYAHVGTVLTLLTYPEDKIPS